MLGQRMAGNFHRQMVNAAGIKIAQGRMQCYRIGCGVVYRAGEFLRHHTQCAEACRRQTGLCPELAQKRRR